MKTYKDIDAFKKRVQKTTDWDDYFMLGGRMYKLYEYGGGGGMFGNIPCYAYFLNKRTRDAVKIEYDLPSVQYVDGKRVEKGEYRFIDLEVIPNMSLWRTDTL